MTRRLLAAALPLLVSGFLNPAVVGQQQGRNPALQELRSDVEFLEDLEDSFLGSSARIQEAELEQAQIRRQLAEVERRFAGSEKRVAAAGMSSSTGSILRRDSSWLPNSVELRRARMVLQQDLAAAQIARFDLIDRFGPPLEPAEAQVGLPRIVGPIEDAERRRLLTRRDELAAERLEGLSRLITLRSGSLDSIREVERAVIAYRAFIEENVFWIRSSSQSIPEWTSGIGPDAVWVIKAITSVQPHQVWLRADLGKRISWAGSLVLAAILFVRRRAIQHWCKAWNEAVKHRKTDRFRRSLFALGATLCLAVPLPLLLWVAGGVVQGAETSGTWILGGQLQVVATAWLMFRMVCRALEPEGIVPNHFHWSAETSRHLLKEVRWLEPVWLLGLLLAFPVEVGSWSESLGRLGYLLMYLALAIFVVRVCQTLLIPDGDASENSWIARLLPLWKFLGVAIPFALCLAAFLGFLFTVEQVHSLIVATLLLAIGLLLAQGLLFRWLAVVRRRLAVAQALEARRHRAAVSEGPTSGSGNEVTFQDLDHVHIPSVDAQTRRLFKSALTLASIIGLFLIWRGLFPALSNLSEFEVWPHFGPVAEVAEPGRFAPESPAAEPSEGAPLPLAGFPNDVDSSSSPAAVTEPASLSLGELLLALATLVVTLIFARNLPALLELTLLQRLPIDGGTRYAITTLVRYLVLLIGLGATSHAIGLGWHQVQWLAAALTFGLAFGLQEIFANFVSGLIILFERPVRVGDIVTVGDTEGKVMQLRMRATTIQDYDLREMLVPNKEFITHRVINWTLTDPVTRVIISVGIAYGSDTNSARATLLACAKEEPLVLEHPEPVAIFRNFGESSLDFQLRVFIGNREHWPMVVDRLHQAIDDAFRKLGIVIAFPQRDVHIHQLKNDPPPPGDGS